MSGNWLITTSCLKRFLCGFAGIPDTKELDLVDSNIKNNIAEEGGGLSFTGFVVQEVNLQNVIIGFVLSMATLL